MVRRRQLHRQQRGVYALGAPSPAPEARWAAALLAAGEGSFLVRTTAASAVGLLAVRHVIEVGAPTQRRGDATLNIHHITSPKALTRHKGLPITTIPQTLLDLAACRWPIDQMTQRAAGGLLVSLRDVRAFAAQRRGEPGAAALARAAGQPETRSQAEDRFLRLLSERGLPAPQANAKLGHVRPDFLWPEHALVVQLDTEQTHGTAAAKRKDAQDDAHLRSRGLTVLRFRAEELHPDQVAFLLKARTSRVTLAG